MFQTHSKFSHTRACTKTTGRFKAFTTLAFGILLHGVHIILQPELKDALAFAGDDLTTEDQGGQEEDHGAGYGGDSHLENLQS